jgi:hypothetical protein
MTDEVKKKIENQFRERMKVQQIKWGSKKFYDAQTEFFSGAMTAIHTLTDEVPSSAWSIAIMRSSSIIEKY